MITPDGAFYNCEHLPEENSWGDLYHGITNAEKFNALRKTMPIDAQCAECPFLPRCTPFYKNGCDCWFEKCREYRTLTMEFVLHSLLSGAEQSVFEDIE